MKRIIQASCIAAAIFLFGACREDHSKHQHQQGEEQHAAAVYQCPMKCEGDKTYDQPGTCPVCSMDLKQIN